MKRLALFVVLVMLSLVLAACAQQPAPVEAPDTPAEEEVVAEPEEEVVAEEEEVTTEEEEVVTEEEEEEAEVVELRIMYHPASPGVDEPVLTEVIERFEADNPDIDVIIDFVGREVYDQNLPLLLEAGEGPDMARVLQVPDIRQYFLDLRPYTADAAYWDENLSAVNSYLSGGTDELFGYRTDLTVTGPYINRTLWEQAEVAVPSDASDSVSWEEWAAAATEVKDALGLPHAMVMDPSGHRFAGPAISNGAKYFDDDGNVALVGDEGFKNMLILLVDWHQTGVMPLEIWAGAEGQSLDAAGEFINANSPFYMSGSWQVSRFESEIGDAFDWEVIPNPCGPGGCTGMPGGGSFVAFKHTQHPEEVARVMDYLASQEVQAEFASRTLLIPEHAGLAEVGVDFQTTTEAGAEALNIWLASEVSPIASQLINSPLAGTIFDKTKARIIQAVTEELAIDEAIERMQQDIENAGE